MVVGDREVMTIEHFSPLKKALQRLGSWVVRRASQTTVPDTTSGFRAYNREAALSLQVVSNYTYTLETIIQAGKMLIAVDHVPIKTNAKTRESRLFPSMWSYIRRNGVSIFRVYSMYEPLRVFMLGAIVIGLVALVVWGRFFYFFAFEGEGGGHVQSLILGAVLFNAAMLLAALGIIGDLLSGQRIMLQRTFERVRRIELELGVPPSHYEPGSPRAGPRAHHRRARRPPRADRGARGGEAVSRRDARRRGHGHRQHLRQVRLHQPGRPAADGGLRGHARGAVQEGRPAVAARRRLRRGGPHPRVGAEARAAARRRARPRGSRDPGGVGAAPGAQPRVQDHEGGEPAVRRRRVRRRDRDRGARARPRPRAHGRRDGARGPALAARLGAARAAVARAQRRARRLHQGPRQHPRARQPLVQARVRGAARAATARSSRRARRSRGRCCSSGSDPRLARRRPATAAAPASSRSASPSPGSSRSRTSRSRPTSSTTSSTSRSRCCGRCCS